ncbi:MAG: hypothetical protein QM765_09250 [Myxococcales bacterium]
MPVDGAVVVGTSAVDQAPITGESVPVEKRSGAKVSVGTVNRNGALEVRATRLATDSTLGAALDVGRGVRPRLEAGACWSPARSRCRSRSPLRCAARFWCSGFGVVARTNQFVELLRVLEAGGGRRRARQSAPGCPAQPWRAARRWPEGGRRPPTG